MSKIINFLQKKEIPSFLFTLLLALYFTLVVNVALVLDLVDILSKLDSVKLGFEFSIFFFFVAAFNVIFTVFSIRYLAKPFFIMLVLVSSLVSYAKYQYGIIFDTSMIDNIAQTDIGEASSYLNLELVIWFLLMGVLPAFLIYIVPIRYASFGKEILYKLASVFVSFAVIGVIAIFYYVDYASVVRNNSNLRKYIIPTYYIASTVKYIKRNYFTAPIKYEYIATDAKKIVKNEKTKPNLTILVVGETARAMNYQLNGYDRPTNHYTKDLGVIYFKNTMSCGTATAVSVPCMFAIEGRKDYSQKRAYHQDNILDVVKRAGVNVVWLENNSSCKGVCKNVKTIDLRKTGIDKDKYCKSFVCRDEIFIPNIKDYISKLKASETKQDNLIVLHIMGSHGPTYYKRYTNEFKEFKPDCPKSDIQNCTKQEIINTYDNTILYTDYVLSEIIKLLKNNEDKFNTAMIYMSDHGESLGENGLYLHGMPYSLAPKEQTHVPFIIWFSDDFKKSLGLHDKCINQLAKTGGYSHDNLFYTLLGLLEVRTKIYDNTKDIFHSCHKMG